MISQIDFIARLRFDGAGYLRLAEQVLLAREIEEIRNKGIPDQMPKSSN